MNTIPTLRKAILAANLPLVNIDSVSFRRTKASIQITVNRHGSAGDAKHPQGKAAGKAAREAKDAQHGANMKAIAGLVGGQQRYLNMLEIAI